MTDAGDSTPTQFVDEDFQRARFNRVDLSGAVLRGVAIGDMEVDSPWLCESGNSLYVNGVDVAPLVDAELDRRFAGRELRRADDPDGLRAAWAALERTWSRTVGRVAAAPDRTVDISVDDEWSFAQTLRHLIMATDTWLGKAILDLDQPFHPLGQPDTGFTADGGDASVFTDAKPAYADVLDARADRVAMVRQFLANVTVADLATPRENPHDQRFPETTLSCIHTILEEEWEHHRYAVRDLDAIDAGR